MNELLNLLIVEDQEDDVLLTVRELRRGGFEPTWECIQTAEDMWIALAGKVWDVIVSDYKLPRFSAPAALKVAQEHDRDIPFILVSGTIGEEHAVDMMKNGAHDYVMKDKLQRLPEAVRREIREAQIRQERQRSQQTLQQRSHELEILNRSGQDLNKTLTLDQVVDSAIRGVSEATPCDLVLLFRREQEELLLLGIGPATSGFTSREHKNTVHRVGECLCGLAISTARPVFSTNIHADLRCTLRECKKAGLRSCVTIPLQGGDEMLGVLALAKAQEYDFQQQAPFLETIAFQIATAMHNALLHERVLHHFKMLGAILHNAPDGIGLIKNGILSWANDQLLDITGYCGKELLGQDKRMLFPSIDEVKRVDIELEAQIKKQGKGSVETRWQTKDGQIRDIFMGLSPINPRDFSQGLVFSAQDITERKFLEYQLSKAQKLEAIGVLAGGIAHDFNNLLTAIIGHSEIILMELEEKNPLGPHLCDIVRAAEQGSSLTKQLLAFSRRQIMTTQVLNLNDIIAEMENMLRRLIREDIAIETLLDPALGLIKADLGQLQQVLMNLVVNARDAMSTGGKIIIATANIQFDGNYEREKIFDISPGDYVMLTVKDNGAGMDELTQAHIFEPFFTTKELGKGTGLGLATV
jgi:PAS domain S-box-containing protein